MKYLGSKSNQKNFFFNSFICVVATTVLEIINPKQNKNIIAFVIVVINIPNGVEF